MNRRPTGVVICAVLLSLVSGLFLLLAVFSGLSAAIAPTMSVPAQPGLTPPPQGFVAALMIFNALLYLAFAGWGSATVVGLVRMRPWSRVSMIVIGSGMILLGLLGALGSFAAQMLISSMPLPPNADPRILRIVFLSMALVSLAGAGIGLWWVVYFALWKTRDAFQLVTTHRTEPQQWRAGDVLAPMSQIADYNIGPRLRQAPAPSEFTQSYPSAAIQRIGRPTSVTVIAILLLIGSFSSLMQMLSSMPLFMFGVMLSGWSAHITMLMWCAVCGVSGLGLLKLQKPAWMLAIGLFCVTFLNALLLTLPSSRRHFAQFVQLAVQRSTSGMPAPQLPAQFMTTITLVGVVFSVLLTGTLLVLLWRARWAFEVQTTN